MTFFLYSITVGGVVTSLTGAWSETKTIQGTTARIAEVIDGESEQGGSRHVPSGPFDIVFDDVSFSHGDTAVLRNVSHTFARGSCTVLVGPNGSGKSTMLALIQRLYEPTAGSISIEGSPIAEYRLADYRASMSSAPQDVPIVSGTVRTNLLIGLADEYEDRELESALALGCGTAFLENMPQGLDTPVGEFGVALSGGQRQRIAMARALLRKSATVLLDEPTAAMDSTTTRSVLRALRESTAGRTVILVAHTPLTVDIADQVVVLENGIITGSGTPETVASHHSFFREFRAGRA